MDALPRREDTFRPEQRNSSVQPRIGLAESVAASIWEVQAPCTACRLGRRAARDSFHFGGYIFRVALSATAQNSFALSYTRTSITGNLGIFSAESPPPTAAPRCRAPTRRFHSFFLPRRRVTRLFLTTRCLAHFFRHSRGARGAAFAIGRRRRKKRHGKREREGEIET